MARRSIQTATEEKASQPPAMPRISLTLMQADSGEMIVKVGVTEFIAYSQNTGFTRLNLTGGKVVDVKETTDQIDRMVRTASAQPALFDNL
jgi:hypothetical protein